MKGRTVVVQTEVESFTGGGVGSGQCRSGLSLGHS